MRNCYHNHWISLKILSCHNVTFVIIDGFAKLSWWQPAVPPVISDNEIIMATLSLQCVVQVMNSMMTSSNGNIFRVTGPLCGEFTGPGEFPTQRPVTRSFDVFFDLRLNKRLSKQPWGWWFGTPSWSLWRQWNAIMIDIGWCGMKCQKLTANIGLVPLMA